MKKKRGQRHSKLEPMNPGGEKKREAKRSKSGSKADIEGKVSSSMQQFIPRLHR